jgi:dethiobiotin synthetase
MHGKVKAVFITGTDTDAGKTVFCGQLLAFLRKRGIDAISQKWAQTGWGESDDAAFHASVAKCDQTEPLDLTVPVRFQYPASPHLAARLENRTVDMALIKNSFNELSQRHDLVLCEGSGGALAPLTDDTLMTDFAAQLGIPAVIVSANKLGCINHTLMTVESLRARNVPILGIAFSKLSPECDEVIARDNVETVHRLSREAVLGELIWLEKPGEYWTDFEAIGESFLKQWGECSG